jgi:hypothetical protein
MSWQGNVWVRVSEKVVALFQGVPLALLPEYLLGLVRWAGQSLVFNLKS